MLLRFLPILLLVAALIFSGLTPTEAPPMEPAGTDILEYRQIEAPEPEVMIFEATAYCYGNITKTGTSPVEGRTIAVDPEVIPLGSRVYVSCESWPEVNGWYIAEDTGGVIKGNIIDVYMQDYDTCLQFGRRQVEVRVLGVRQ